MLCCVVVGVVNNSSLQKTSVCASGPKNLSVNDKTVVNGHAWQPSNKMIAASEPTAATTASTGMLIWWLCTLCLNFA